MRYQLNFRPEPFQGYTEFDEFEFFDAELADGWQGEVNRSPAYIKWVQASLNKIMGLRLAVDGDAGPQTRSAIRSFQKRRGLKEDGQVNQSTEQALVAAGAVAPPSITTKSAPSVKPAPAPVISPLANTQAGLRVGYRRRTHPVYGICVHTTSGGPARKAQKDPRTSALDRALSFYLHGKEGFPHYLIGYDGTIYGTCSENQLAAHAGWTKGGKPQWANWKAPAWWSNVWKAWVGPNATPVSLLPPKANNSPNEVYLGVELLADTTGWGFTDAQYKALAGLVLDIAKRYQLPLTAAPSPRLLGHEDVDPMTRSNKNGGWDPGAHRDVPKFSWGRLWQLITTLGKP